MVFVRRVGLATVLALFVVACGLSDPETLLGAENSPSELPLVVPNQGGSLEGHTPRGFAGRGTGLFVGDNLNQQFPDGDGVQIWLTFDLLDTTPVPTRAVVRSEVMSVVGDPFADLGELVVEPVTYDSFGPELFALGSDGAAAVCQRVGPSGLECDVTTAVVGLVESGRLRVQFRVRFETPGDKDGQQDLAMFFFTDSNTNERGIFTLELS